MKTRLPNSASALIDITDHPFSAYVDAIGTHHNQQRRNIRYNGLKLSNSTNGSPRSTIREPHSANVEQEESFDTALSFGSMENDNDELPDWVASRIEEPNYNKDLTQRGVAQEFVHGDRPFYNVSQMHAALGGSVSDDTVRSRLKELNERDVLQLQEVNNGKIYWLDMPESNWPIPPDVDVEPKTTEITLSEWRSQTHIQTAAASILIAILGTAVTLVGVFQTGGYYQLPISGSELITYGLSAALMSYVGLFASGAMWIFAQSAPEEAFSGD